jgi:transcriptional regulator with XRE-family HTH domain
MTTTIRPAIGMARTMAQCHHGPRSASPMLWSLSGAACSEAVPAVLVRLGFLGSGKIDMLRRDAAKPVEANHTSGLPATFCGRYGLLVSETGKRDAGRSSVEAPGGHAPDQQPERVFARRMKRERLRRGMRQEDLAELLAATGVELHPSAIAKIERDPDPDKGVEPRMIRLNEAQAIATVLRLPIDRMLSDDDLSDPAKEVARLEQELAAAEQRRAAAEATAHNAAAAMAALKQKIEAARRRAAESAVANADDVVAQPLLDAMAGSPDVREGAEQFIAHWFRRQRDDFVKEGWGRNHKGDLLDPQEVLGQIGFIANVFPDLRQVCKELRTKLEADVLWWDMEGRSLHDLHLRDEWRRRRPTAAKRGPGKQSGGGNLRRTPQAERLAEKLGVSLPADQKPAFAVGDRVSHERHGIGRVLAVEGTGAREQVQVDFGDATMWLVARHAPMEKVYGPGG